MDRVENGRLSDDEFKEFVGFLKRFCAHDLDQWEAWQTATPSGPVYANMTRSLPPETDPSAFRSI
ncbi:hypothetical protein [Streptomyces sp. ISID311]|uniref:hypothetical protein n=1 Tax=Streptomyces sp. ISID311 TaxID=2601673 RepID=UPI0011BD35A1|nr:hypothetical protein [Streptomyces sp. ISID311]TXC98893.1 hypothetical protein FS847_05760 [Streptomyces sp. ISID311]